MHVIIFYTSLSIFNDEYDMAQEIAPPHSGLLLKPLKLNSNYSCGLYLKILQKWNSLISQKAIFFMLLFSNFLVLFLIWERPV